MKRLCSLCLALIFIASFLHVRAFAAEMPQVPEIISETAVLMDAMTGQVLYQKNAAQRMYPASTTKIMTGLLVAEHSNPDEIATVTASAIDIEEWDSASIYLVENEQMSVDSLLYAMMMPSANDASNVLAEHVAGSQVAFADLMNARAAAIGANSTHFANAHGLHDPNHYTTAYDLALITKEAMQNKIFAHYFGAATQTIPATNLNPYERAFMNYQYMLVDTSEYYEPAVTGGKVGYTHEAEHTMSTIAEKDGRVLICTVMKSPNRGDKFADTKALLDFGFDGFAQVSVSRDKFPGFDQKITQDGEEVGFVAYESTDDFQALLPNGISASAIKVSYSFTEPQDAPYGEVYAEFYAETGNAAIPEWLGRQKLTSNAVLHAPAEPATLAEQLTALANEHPWILPLTAFCIVLTAFLLFLLAGKISANMREKRRQEKLEEALAQLEAKETTPYSGPVPVVGKQFLRS